MTSKNITALGFHVCREGEPGSAVQLNRTPEAHELAILAKAGLTPATVGKAFRKTVRCPVNGDGYWYTRRELLDSKGAVVGSVRDDSGPSGEL